MTADGAPATPVPDRPTPVAGATATLVALLAALPAALASRGGPIALAFALVGGGLLGAAVPWLGPDDPRRRALASVALVPGGLLTALAALAAGPFGAVVAVTVAGVAVFAAGLGAAGRVTTGDLTRLLVGLVANFAVLSAAATLAAAVHVGVPAAVGGVLVGVVGLLADLGAANVAATVAMGAIEAAALAALGGRAARATPVEELTGEDEDLAAALSLVEDALGGLAPWLALVALMATVVALLVPVLASLSPLVSGPATAIAGATRPLHAASWTLVVVLSGYLLALWLGRALVRRSPAGLARRTAGAAGGLASAALVAGLLTAVPFGRLVAAVAGPRATADLVDLAGSVGAATLVYVVLALVLVPAAGTVLCLLAVVGLRLVPERGAGAAIAAALLFVAALAAGAAGSVAGALLGATAALVVWDAGEHAASLGAHVGRGGRTRRAELVHVGAGVGVGALAVAVGVVAVPVAVLVARLARPGYAAVALVLLLVTVLALVSLVSGR